jgi:hypothetical protein
VLGGDPGRHFRIDAVVKLHAILPCGAARPGLVLSEDVGQRKVATDPARTTFL